jgi:hypothetical protein
MRTVLRSRNPRTAIPLVVLFVALGGGAYAAITLPGNSAGATQPSQNAVASSVKDGSAASSDFSAGPRGPQRTASRKAKLVLNLIGTPVFEPEVIPKGGTEVGTRRVFSEDLRVKNTNQPVGRHSGTCTLVRTPGWWLCHAGWTLKEVGPGGEKAGTLVAGALFDFGAGKPPFRVAIFGGTGDFDTVRGQIAATPIPGTADWRYTLELVP